MTNEMKLLTALCDALGFDVKAVCVNQHDIDMQHINIKNEFKDLSMWSVFDSKLRVNLIQPIYEYRLAKIDDTEHEDAELAAIVRARSDQPEVKISPPCPLAQFKAGHNYSASLKDKE